MTNTEMLQFCLTEVELYVEEMFSANKDTVGLLKNKADLLRTIVRSIKVHEETAGVEKYFEAIGNQIKGLRKVKGTSSFESISEKVYNYIEQIDFIKEIKQYE